MRSDYPSAELDIITAIIGILPQTESMVTAKCLLHPAETKVVVSPKFTFPIIETRSGSAYHQLQTCKSVLPIVPTTNCELESSIKGMTFRVIR